MSAPVQPVVHTPGPWKVSRRFDIYEDTQKPGVGGTFIGSTRGNWPLPEHINERCEADARLIAAAPDLLAACLAFIAADNQCGANLAFVMAQEAVKKAGVAPKENGGETCDMKHGPCSCGATH